MQSILWLFSYLGTKIAEVEIPEGEKIHQQGAICKAHRIILKNIRPFWTREMLEILANEGINIHANDVTKCRLGFKYSVKALENNKIAAQ